MSASTQVFLSQDFRSVLLLDGLVDNCLCMHVVAAIIWKMTWCGSSPVERHRSRSVQQGRGTHTVYSHTAWPVTKHPTP